jgi:tyrosyl-tRNA synthetase
MMPLLEGTDGSLKMSKSYDNYIGINEEPNDMYGKVLSIPDELIYRYYELVTDIATDKLPEIMERVTKDPRNTKHDLAFTITRMYHGEVAAKNARKHFERTVVNKEIPDDAPEIEFEPGTTIRLLDIISDAEMTQSNGETKRLMKQGGVSIDDDKVKDVNHEITFAEGDEYNLKVGKRKYAKLVSR